VFPQSISFPHYITIDNLTIERIVNPFSMAQVITTSFIAGEILQPGQEIEIQVGRQFKSGIAQSSTSLQ
jgi:hypothetical protein